MKIRPIKTRMQRLLTAVCLPVAVVGITLPAQAQETSDPADQTVTVCEYDPSTGIVTPLIATSSLDVDAFITIREAGGDTIFTYEKPSALVLVEDDEAESMLPRGENAPINPDLSVERSFAMRGLALTDARQLMIDQPAYYAQLLGISMAQLGDRTFAEIDRTLLCQTETGEGSETTPPQTSTPQPPTAANTLESLPDGNYRMTSAEYPQRIVTDEELLTNGGYLFVFRKLGNVVTGAFGHIDHETSACITGTVSGNTITGEAYTVSEPTVINGTTYLGPLGVLELGDRVTDEVRYDNSIMTVDSLFRINAGTRLPTESCP